MKFAGYIVRDISPPDPLQADMAPSGSQYASLQKRKEFLPNAEGVLDERDLRYSDVVRFGKSKDAFIRPHLYKKIKAFPKVN